MPISIYIDNNVWDFLFNRRLDLAAELPRPDYCICITREAEFEIPPIPDAKSDLKRFIEDTVRRCEVKTDSFFGFYVDSHPAHEQRYGGFGQGRWITPEESAFIDQQRTSLRSRLNPKSRLHGNEADLSLAARSLHSVVLTCDQSAGPLNAAYRQGGKIVYLDTFDSSGMSLRAFIADALN
jgi:hypothetical protein